MSPSADPENVDLARLRWRCRRGMLELDLVLARFLETEYPRLTKSEQESFAALLCVEDASLLAMLEGRQEAGRFAPLIRRLRAC